MDDELHEAIRVIYQETTKHRSTTEAFERAVEAMRSRKALPVAEARKEVARMLAVEPAATELE
jgi:hypothetical protein